MKNYLPRLLGNEETRARIGSAIESGRMPHAFLICGPEGSGKKTLATEIAAALNCTGGGNSLPCGACTSCRRIYSGGFTDVKILGRTKDRATIGVGAVKDFREDMFLSATESDYKVYIIDEAETMTTEAQNALLKVLEEPPSGVVIILLATEGDKILSTIRSRAQHVATARFDAESLVRILCERSPAAAEMRRSDPEGFRAAIMSADGRIGEAERLMDKKLSDALSEERKVILDVVRSLRSGTPFGELYSALSALPQKRGELLGALELLITAIRDVIAQKNSSRAHLLFFTSKEECGSMGDGIGARRAGAAYDAICTAHDRCSRNANTVNIISALSASLAEI